MDSNSTSNNLLSDESSVSSSPSALHDSNPPPPLSSDNRSFDSSSSSSSFLPFFSSSVPQHNVELSDVRRCEIKTSFSLKDEEDVCVLSAEKISKTLKRFGRTFEGRFAFLEAEAQDLQLTNIDAIRNFPYLQVVNVSGNSLTSLEALISLRQLTHLYASKNCLTELVVGFSKTLTVVDVSYNRLTCIKAWSIDTPNVQELNIRCNLLTSLSASISLNRNLKKLDIADNRLKTLKDIPDGLTLLELNVASNQLQSLVGVERLKRLRRLDVSFNLLYSLHDFEVVKENEENNNNNEINSSSNTDDSHTSSNCASLRFLSYLNLSGNPISGIDQLQSLRHLTFLQELSLFSTPLLELPTWKFQLLNLAPQLLRVNNINCSPEEKVRVTIAYGAEVERRLQIWENFLPGEEFIDRRILILSNNDDL